MREIVPYEMKRYTKRNVKDGIQPSIAVVNAYTLIAVLYTASSCLLFYNIVNNIFLAIIHLLALVSVLLNYLILKRTRNFQRATTIILITGTVVVVCLFATGGWENTGYLWPFAYLPFAFFLTRGQDTLFWILFLFCGCFIATGLHVFGFIVIPYSSVAIFNYFAALLVFTLCTMLFQQASINYEEFRAYTRDFFDVSLEAFVIIDEHDRISDANQMVEKIIGVSREKLIGTSFSSYFTSPESVQKICGELFSAGVVQNFPLSISRAGGDVVNVLLNATVYHDQATRTQQIFAVVHDITEQKKAEDALRESEEQTQMIFKASPDAVIVIDQEGVITQWNSQAEILLEWTAEEVIGKPLHETIIPFRFREAHVKGLKTFLATGEGPVLNRTIEIYAVKKEGQEISVELTISKTYIKGRYLFIGFLRDTAERKVFQDQIKRTTDFLDTIIENIPHMLFIKDAEELRFVKLNKAGEELLGYSRDDLIGKNDHDFFSKDQADAFVQSDHKVLEEGKLMDIPEEPVNTKYKGLRYLRTKKLPIFDSSGKPVYMLGISEDITDLKKTHDELKERTGELKRSNMELEQFAYVASHDLQEPLRMVTNYLQLLQKEYSDKLDTDANEFIEYAVDGAKRMRTLIHGLLEYSRIGRAEASFDKVNLDKIVRNVIRDLDQSIKESEAVIQCDPLPTILANGMHMQQLFQNLIGNAIKFRGDKKPGIQITYQTVDTDYLFSVRDNGIGFDPRYAEKVFLIFQRLHNRGEYSGTGIGLAVCKKIIERYQGKIWVESSIGEGSVFHFTIKQ